MPSLNTKLLSDVPIYYPCIHEQRAIAHILSNLDDKIELNRKMNQTLEAISKAIFKSWFVDFDSVRAKANGESAESICRRLWLTPSILTLFPDRFKDSELGEIPAGWKIENVANLTEITAGKRQEQRQDKPSTEYTVPLYGGAGPVGYVSRPLFSDSVIVTGRVGTLGVVHRVTHPIWPSDNTLVIKAKKSNAFEFLYISLLNMDLQNLNRGSTQPLLTQRDLGQQLLIVPQDELLKSFTEITHSMFSRIDANREEIALLSRLRDALLPSLLSGEIKVPVDMCDLG